MWGWTRSELQRTNSKHMASTPPAGARPARQRIARRHTVPAAWCDVEGMPPSLRRRFEAAAPAVSATDAASDPFEGLPFRALAERMGAAMSPVVQAVRP